MLTERTLINGLIIFASLILAPFAVTEALSNDALPALIAGFFFLVFMAFFFVKNDLAFYPLLALSVQGKINFLPVPLPCSCIAACLVVIYYSVGFVLLTQRPIRLGHATLFWPVLIIVAIILYHVHSLSFGVAGGSTEGARPAFLVYLFTLAYFCGANFPSPSVYFLSKIPLYAVCVCSITSIPYILSTFFPALAPYLYSVTDSVNIEEYVNTQGGVQSVGLDNLSSRLSVFEGIGAALQLYLLVHYPIGTWFSPRRLWVVCLSLVCTTLIVFCGYRSSMFGYTLTTFLGIACYYSWRALLLPLVIFIVFLIFITASDNNLISFPVNKLPMIAQRTLSFLPGDWDPEAIESGKASNEFRENIQDVYLAEYAKESPLLGNGFDINRGQADYFLNGLENGRGDSKYFQAKFFIETKTFHTGWISVYDCVGIIGWLAYIWFQIGIICISGRFIFRKNADRRSILFPLYCWVFCSMTSEIISFYTVFGDFAGYFSDELCYSIVLVHLCRISKQNELASQRKLEETQIGFSGLAHVNYGSKYY